MVVATALAGGFVLSRRGWPAARAGSALVALLGLLLLGFMCTMATPVDSPRGAWICLYGLSLTLLLCLAAALPYPAGRGVRDPWSYPLLGGLCGLAPSRGRTGFT